jgi:hypothetical protein
MADTQSELISPAPRANRKGSPCPPWCAADHGKVLIEARDGRPAVTYDAHSGPDHAAGSFTYACAVQGDYSAPIVHVAVGRVNTHAGLADAEELAKFIEALAGLPAGGIRGLAAAVRLAAGDAQ